MKLPSFALAGVVATIIGSDALVLRRNEDDYAGVAKDFGIDVRALRKCIREKRSNRQSGGDSGENATGGLGIDVISDSDSSEDDGGVESAGGTEPDKVFQSISDAIGALGENLANGDNTPSRRRDDTVDAQDKKKCLKLITGINITNAFGKLADFGLDANGELDMENFNFSSVPVKNKKGFFPLSGKQFSGIPALADAPNFDFDDFDTYPDDFDVTELSFEFDKVPALLAALADFAKNFVAFEPSLDLFNSFSDKDKKLVRNNLNATLTKLDVNISSWNESKLQELADLISKSTPTLDELKGVVNDTSIAEKINANITDIVKGFGKINFFKNLTADEVYDLVKEKLKDSTGAEKKLLAGLQKNWTIKKFCKLVKKAGFDSQGLKKLLANPNNYAKDKNSDRRREDDSAVTEFAKTQVSNQGKLAKTQNDEKKRDSETKDEAKDEANGATTIAISTASIAVSVVAFVVN